MARFKGVTERDAAEKLRNVELYVARDRLPPIETTMTNSMSPISSVLQRTIRPAHVSATSCR